MKKLYVVTRRDLPWPVRSVQAIHAAANLARTLDGEDREQWGPIGPHLVLLGVESQHALAPLAEIEGAVAFHEPDLGDQLTAVAVFTENLDTSTTLL